METTIETVQVELAAGRALIERCFVRVGHTPQEAGVIAGQVMDIELRGAHFGGFNRALSMCQLIAGGEKPTPMRVTSETPVSTVIDGGNNVGYIVAHRATELAIQRARQSGVGVAGAHNTYFTGQYAYYMEMATQQGMVAIAAGSSGPTVAPHGATEGRFGTNPLAFGFPTDADPLIVDIGTSSVMVGDLLLWGRTGRQLDDGVAFDETGQPTRDPAAALRGAIAVWGGHKGSAIALAVQLLGVLAGGWATSPDHRHCGYFVCVIDPAIMLDASAYRETISDYLRTFESARRLDPKQPVRLPFSRSAEERRRQLTLGYIKVPAPIYRQLCDLADGKPIAASALASARLMAAQREAGG